MNCLFEVYQRYTDSVFLEGKQKCEISVPEIYRDILTHSDGNRNSDLVFYRGAVHISPSGFTDWGKANGSIHCSFSRIFVCIRYGKVESDYLCFSSGLGL